MPTILAQDPAGGQGIYDLINFVEFLIHKGPYLLLALLVLVGLVVVGVRLLNRDRERNRK